MNSPKTILKPVLLISLLGVSTAHATPGHWNCASGSWNTPSCWDGNTLPTTTSSVYVLQPADISIDSSMGKIAISELFVSTLGTINDLNSVARLKQTGGTLSAYNENFGFYGLGSMEQSGGSNVISKTLYVGQSQGEGSYNLSSTGILTAENEYIGYYYLTSGHFMQAGGINTTTNLNIAGPKHSSGTYELSGTGKLIAVNETVGEDDGAASFTQTGGSNQVSGDLKIGYAYSSYIDNSYSITDGSLDSNRLFVGVTDRGRFSQSGGSVKTHFDVNSAGNVIYIGYGENANGIYDLSGGSLESFQTVVGQNGTGAFHQSGGSHKTTFLQLAAGATGHGTYQQSGGDATSQLALIADAGTGSYQLSGGSFTSNGLIVGNTKGSLGSFDLTDNGKLTVNSETVGNTGSAVFSQTGGSHKLSGDLTLANNAGSRGVYNLSGGTFAAASIIAGQGDSQLIIDGGNLSLSTNKLSVNSLIIGDGQNKIGHYAFSTGSITVHDETIGGSGNGSLEQSGGKHTIASGLGLGNSAEGRGSYALSGTGELTSALAAVGINGVGEFTQTGGSYTLTKDLTLGLNSGSQGQYKLSGGTLSVNSIGRGLGESHFIYDGGSFTLASGKLTVGKLSVGDGLGSAASYGLTSGSFTTDDEVIGGLGSGTIQQSGGSNSVANSLVLGANTRSQGSYSLSGTGNLAANQLLIGVKGTGSFSQKAGINSVHDVLNLGSGVGGRGSYSLYNGQLTSASEIIGDLGVGEFSQTGGLHTVNGKMILASTSKSNGSYHLNGGSLVAASIQSGAGRSTFDWTGGTLELTKKLNIAKGESVFNDNLTVPTSSQLIVPSLQVASEAAVNQSTASKVSIAGELAVLGNYTLAGGTDLAASTINNTGNMVMSGGFTDIHAQLNNNVGGKISNIYPGGVIQMARFYGNVVNNGEIHTDKNAITLFNDNVSGAGQFTGAGTLLFNGGFAPGNSPAFVTAEGNVILGENS